MLDQLTSVSFFKRGSITTFCKLFYIVNYFLILWIVCNTQYMYIHIPCPVSIPPPTLFNVNVIKTMFYKEKTGRILEYRWNRDKTIFDKLISRAKRKTQEKIKTNKQTIIFLFCEIIYPNFSSLFECPCPNLLFNNIPLTHLQPKIPPLPH